MLSDDSDWERTTRTLIEQPGLRQRILERARIVLQRDYSWRRVEHQVLDLIAALNPPSLSTN